MKQNKQYQPKHLAPASAPLTSYGGAGALGLQYSIYILPDGAESVTAEDVARFPPVPLGDEAAARAFLAQTEAPAKKRHGILWDLLFYLALGAFVLGVFLFRGVSGGAPVTFMGFSAMRVLTTSMQDEIPQGSLIITRRVEPETLEIGDDITYIAGEDMTITHRIVAITEDYQGSGKRAFTTQGIMNASPDSLRVPAANVVGKVIFHNLALGAALSFVREHWTWILLLLALFVGLCESLRVVFRESEKEPKPRRLRRG